ncbi:hypothetical protein BJ912DRAFT_997258 [Pholiota molesta]|nr:hypothetical protein BJ912DRAFT_997258 [Pholiota molesta]
MLRTLWRSSPRLGAVLLLALGRDEPLSQVRVRYLKHLCACQVAVSKLCDMFEDGRCKHHDAGGDQRLQLHVFQICRSSSVDIRCTRVEY